MLDDDGVRKAFEFDLDRSGDDAEEVGKAVQRSYDAFKRSRSGIAPTDWTEFVYKTGKAMDADELEAELLFAAIPYILAFDTKVEMIELRLWGKHEIYKRVETKELVAGSRLTVIEGGETATRFIVHEEDDIQAAVPILERQDGSYELLPLDNVPRLFKFVPLVNSVNIGLPTVFHSRQFSTTEDRDGLMFTDKGPQSDANKEILTKAKACFLQLARNCAEKGIADLDFLLDVSAVSDTPPWLEDETWYTDWQRSMVRELAGIPLLLLDTEKTGPVAEAVLPVGDDSIAWVDVYRLGSRFYYVPGKSIAERCSVIAGNWINS